MSVPMPGPDSHRLHLVPAGGPLTGQRIGVAQTGLPPHTGPAGIPALLTLDPAVDPVCVPVRLVPLAAVPDGVLAVTEDLAPRIGLDDDADRDWRLETVPVEPVGTLTLESSVEAPFDVLARELGEAGLPGTLVWIPPQPDAELWIDVPGSASLRVRALQAGGRRGVLAEIGERTDVELFVSSARNGVDIVILADCSGSMSIPDIPEHSEGGFLGRRFGRRGGRGRPRMDVLRSALEDLLRMRLEISGRVSRLAMVKFTHTTQHVFPRGGGMAELDAGSTGPVVQEFRNAVAILRPENAGTDIGNALHEAANLLYLHGKPGNERLIVLVSDGAHWARRGNDGVGEVVYADREPVSLMEYLHSNTQVRLHAVGVSTMEMYRRWIAEGNRGGDAFEPNHELLQQLVRVGGGDAAAIGGFDVLARYFSGLGAGTTRRVPLTRAQRPRPDAALPPQLAKELRLLAEQHRAGTAAGSGFGTAQDARGLSERLLESTGVAIGESRRALNAPLFRDEPVRMAVNKAVATLRTRPSPTFERDMASVFAPARPPSVPPALTASLDTFGPLLEQLREAGRSRAWDTERRIEWVGRLATAMDALVAVLKPLPDAPATRSATIPAPAPDAWPATQPADRRGTAPAAFPLRDGYEHTDTGSYTPAPAAAPLFRYRGEE